MISFIGTDNNIPLAVLPLGTSAQSTWEKITHQLDLNRVVILCLDANYISGGPNAAGRLDKFYSTTPGFGHFIVVKGYAEVDNNKLYEVYDPYSFGKQNADGTLMGRGRYYRFTDIFNATRVWWNFAMAINPKGQPIDPGTLRTAVDPATIPNAYGY